MAEKLIDFEETENDKAKEAAEAAELAEINRKIAETLQKSIQSSENTRRYLNNLRHGETGEDTVEKCMPYMDDRMRDEIRATGKEARSQMRGLKPDSADAIRGTGFEVMEAKLEQRLDLIDQDIGKIVDDTYSIPKYDELIENVIEETKKRIV